MHKLIRRLDRVLAWTAGLGILFMTLLSLTNALGRTWFGMPIYGANEMVANWFLPALVLLGIPSAQVWKEHINVTLAIEGLGSRSKAWLQLIGYTLATLMCLAFAWWGLDRALSQMAVGETAGITSLPVWPAYFLVPVGFTIAAFIFAVDAYIGFRKPDDEINTATGKAVTAIDD